MEADVAVVEEGIPVGAREHGHRHPFALDERDPAHTAEHDPFIKSQLA